MKRSYPAERIETERLILKRHEPGFAEKMFASVESDRERLRVFLPWVDDTRTLEDEVGYLKMAREKWDEHELFDFSILLKESGEYIGNVGVHTISWDHERGEIGYWVLGNHEGKGYISEAVLGLEKALFAMGFNRIEIHCSALNERSAAVPRRCGYRQEALLRQDRMERGKFRDTLIFAKLRTDR